MDDREIIALVDEEGQEIEFEVLAVINVEDKDYAILTHAEERDDEFEAYIFRIDTDENGEEVFSEVENDDEFEMVKEAWESLCDDELEFEDGNE